MHRAQRGNPPQPIDPPIPTTMAELRQRAGKAQKGAEKQEKKEQGQEEVTDEQPAVDKVKAKREKALTVWWIIAPLSLVALWTFSSAPADLKAYTDDFMTVRIHKYTNSCVCTHIGPVPTSLSRLQCTLASGRRLTWWRLSMICQCQDPSQMMW